MGEGRGQTTDLSCSMNRSHGEVERSTGSGSAVVRKELFSWKVWCWIKKLIFTINLLRQLAQGLPHLLLH